MDLLGYIQSTYPGAVRVWIAEKHYYNSDTEQRALAEFQPDYGTFTYYREVIARNDNVVKIIPSGSNNTNIEFFLNVANNLGYHVFFFKRNWTSGAIEKA